MTPAEIQSSHLLSFIRWSHIHYRAGGAAGQGELKAETGQQSPRHARMATLCLTMASRETKSVIPWKTWQRANHAREFAVGQQVFLDFLR